MPDGSIRRPDFGAKLEGDIPATWVNPEGEDRIGIIRGDTVFFKHDFSLVPYASPDSTNSMIYPISQVDVSYPNGTGYTARISLKEVLAPKTWTIKGEKGMIGTVEIIGGLLWHIKSPVETDIWYGILNDIPATWVDPDTGKDSLAVIRMSNNMVYLDKNYTGAIGEIEKKISEVTITYPNRTDYTARVSVISAPTPPTTCTEGTTRQVKCPKTNEMITQRCTGDIWVTIKEDEGVCVEPEDLTLHFIAIIVLIIALAYLILRK